VVQDTSCVLVSANRAKEDLQHSEPGELCWIGRESQPGARKVAPDSRMHVLIVEDEKKMAELLKKGLEEEGHSATLGFDGPSGLGMAQTYNFDAIVLDVMLPGLDGFEVARRLRRIHNQTPILMLTARDAVPDIVKGLDVGADDYLTKPFSFEEFLARLRAVSRRGPVPQPARLEVGDLVLEPATREVQRGSQAINLTRTEYALLELLMRRAGRVVSRAAILDAVWGFDKEIENNTLDVFIKLLRGKIDGGRKDKLIHTVRGIGYCVRKSGNS